MFKRILLFPSSMYLRDRWWHRLATVVFWGWLIAVAMLTLKLLVLDPFRSCVSAKYAFPNDPLELDCGSNMFDYAFSNVANEPFSSILLGTAFVVLVLYIVAVLPSALYRLALYVAKGAAWKDSHSAAA